MNTDYHTTDTIIETVNQILDLDIEAELFSEFINHEIAYRLGMQDT